VVNKWVAVGSRIKQTPQFKQQCHIETSVIV
jgi:hypothetical protein